MKLEDQLVSLELSMKLKKLGVKQESLWYWYEDETLVIPCRQGGIIMDKDARDNSYSAFTVVELGKIIMYIPNWTKLWKEYIEKFVCKRPMNVLHYLFQPNNLAEFYLYLIEHKLMEV